jgi:hypothetical protein
MTSIPPEIRAALEEVLAYYTEDEERDFEAREDEDRTHHSPRPHRTADRAGLEQLAGTSDEQLMKQFSSA